MEPIDNLNQISSSMKQIRNDQVRKDNTNLTKNYCEEKLITDPCENFKKEIGKFDMNKDAKGRNTSADFRNKNGLSHYLPNHTNKQSDGLKLISSSQRNSQQSQNFEPLPKVATVTMPH